MSGPENTSAPIPVTLLTGFLGSGKTTLLNELVQQPAMADALVIINEFGAIALDHMLVAHSTENLVMEMGSGCLCCTVRSDLVRTLKDIPWRFSRGGKRQFSRVLIETTGLADPAPIIHTLMTHPQLAGRYCLDGVAVTVDLAAGMQALDQHAEAVRQVAMADCLLLTKADLAQPVARDALLRSLDALNPAAPRWKVEHGHLDAARLLELGHFPAMDKQPEVWRWLRQEGANAAMALHAHAHHHEAVPKRNFLSSRGLHDSLLHHDISRHDEDVRAYCYALEHPVSMAGLQAWQQALLRQLDDGLLRVKGVCNIADHSQPLVLQGVRHGFSPPVWLPAWPDAGRLSRLVVIARNLDRKGGETWLRQSLGMLQTQE